MAGLQFCGDLLAVDQPCRCKADNSHQQRALQERHGPAPIHDNDSKVMESHGLLTTDALERSERARERPA